MPFLACSEEMPSLLLNIKTDINLGHVIICVPYHIYKNNIFIGLVKIIQTYCWMYSDRYFDSAVSFLAWRCPPSIYYEDYISQLIRLGWLECLVM